MRSHSYAVAHAQAGAELSPHPECTFDEGEALPPLRTVHVYDGYPRWVDQFVQKLKEQDGGWERFEKLRVDFKGRDIFSQHHWQRCDFLPDDKVEIW